MNEESNRIRENRTLEFKEDLTNTFLKTVSAFSNYDGGIILFGVNDSGIPVGLENPKQACLDIYITIQGNGRGTKYCKN